MIRVTVTLISAINGSHTELARMDIANDGIASNRNFRYGDYEGQTYRGRDKSALDKGTISKQGSLKNFPRLQLHVWNMVYAMLHSMGYTQGIK